MSEKFCYCIESGDVFKGSCDSIDDAFDEAVIDVQENLDCYNVDHGDVVEIQLGKVIPCIDILRKRVDWLGEYAIDRIEEYLYDEVGYPDDNVIEIADEKQLELSHVIFDWLEQNVKFNRHGVDLIEAREYQVQLED
jgi:hypothetical protein